MDHQPILVDEVVPDQGLDQRAAAGNLDALVGLLPEPPDRRSDSATDQDRALPGEGLGQPRRDDVLGKSIESVPASGRAV